MSRDDIIRMAREAGSGLTETDLDNAPWVESFLERFAALVASERDIGWHKIVHDECEAAIKEEREAILQMSADNWYKTQKDYDEAIRQRSNHGL